MVKSTNHRFRVVTIFRRLERITETVVPPLPEYSAAG
jgi:hypothetical protein